MATLMTTAYEVNYAQFLQKTEDLVYLGFRWSFSITGLIYANKFHFVDLSKLDSAIRN
jgi:hypothetical protein